MKLSDIFEADVVDFAQKKKERDFINKIGAMSRDSNMKQSEVNQIASDIDAADERDRALAMDVQRKYTRIV